MVMVATAIRHHFTTSPDKYIKLFGRLHLTVNAHINLVFTSSGEKRKNEDLQRCFDYVPRHLVRPGRPIAREEDEASGNDATGAE